MKFYESNPEGASVMIGVQLGTLDDDPGVGPEFHCFVVGKALWFTITDALPQFSGLPSASAPAGESGVGCG